ncbi:hypothetical protein GGX14DRAFT_383957 [Mycena pura]|uniref:Uncharacterized protein n=1 Tax=Mycena pura TaxID=153505 RepID=A0AAD6YUR4_9AGAR|nr:hypothetical protein GGX14DRAFT_383957 [Mycena pura]
MLVSGVTRLECTGLNSLKGFIRDMFTAWFGPNLSRIEDVPIYELDDIRADAIPMYNQHGSLIGFFSRGSQSAQNALLDRRQDPRRTTTTALQAHRTVKSSHRAHPYARRNPSPPSKSDKVRSRTIARKSKTARESPPEPSSRRKRSLSKADSATSGETDWDGWPDETRQSARPLGDSDAGWEGRLNDSRYLAGRKADSSKMSGYHWMRR